MSMTAAHYNFRDMSRTKTLLLIFWLLYVLFIQIWYILSTTKSMKNLLLSGFL